MNSSGFGSIVMVVVMVGLMCWRLSLDHLVVRDAKRKREADHQSRNGLDGWDEIG